LLRARESDPSIRLMGPARSPDLFPAISF